MFAVRRHKGLPEYDEALCIERWKLQHFMKHHRVYQVDDDSHFTDVTVDVQSTLNQQVPSRLLTEHEKYRKAFIIAQDLAQRVSICGMKDFESGIQELENLRCLWDQGKRVKITALDVTGKYNSK